MMRKLTLVFALAMAFCSLSCVQLDLKYTQEEYEVERPVEYSFDYGQTSVLPESVTVAQINTMIPARNLTFECPPSGSTVNVANGEWRALAISSKQYNVIYHGLDSFIKKEIASIKDITAEIDTMTYSEISALRGALDVNPGFPYLKVINGLYTSYSEFDVSPTGSNRAAFKMVDLSTPMKFTVHYEIDKGVELLSAFAEVSGVPSMANVMNREILTEKIGKISFPMTVAGTGLLEGNTSGMGIIPSDDGSTTYGRGVFTIRFRVMINGERYAVIGSINIKDLIEAVDFYEVSDRPGVYTKKTGGEVVFNIPGVLHVTAKGLEDQSGVKRWVSQAFVDEEI